MIKQKMFILIFLLIFLSCNNEVKYLLPAEWEAHKAMIVSFDNEPDADSVVIEMVKHLSKEMNVYCIVLTDSISKLLENEFLNNTIDLDRIQFITLNKDIYPFSCRDPLFFVKERSGKLNIMNFRWMDYGLRNEPWFKPEWATKFQKQFDFYKNKFQSSFGYEIVSSNMVLEGGAIEVNSNGIVLQVEAVNMHRNPDLTKHQQEEELKKFLGIEKVIWLKEGVAEDPLGPEKLITINYFGIGTKGHVDEFCRFVNDSTIFIAFPDSIEAQSDPVKKITRDRMELNYKILKNATDLRNEPFKIVKIPVPNVEYKKFVLDTIQNSSPFKSKSKYILADYPGMFNYGDTVNFVPATGYLNYLVTNNLILLPSYWKPGMPDVVKDEDSKVKTLFEHYFPNRKIIQINPLGLNYNGGGIHCWSQQIPQ